MGVDVTTAIEIERPISEVATYAMDPDHATVWYKRITSVTWETPRPLAVGSRIAFTAQFLGRSLAYTYEVTELVSGERFTQATTQGPFPMETAYWWESLSSGGTRMYLRNRGQPAGFSRLTAPMLGQAIKRANRKDLVRLKQILESNEQTPT